MQAKWNPDQYNKFKAQRAQPFHDLLALIDRREKLGHVADLGCGTGELSRRLFDELKPVSMIGIDSSPEMLVEAGKFQTPGLEFELGDISSARPQLKLDLLFSNAALQWVPDHERLFPRLLDWVVENRN